jgi:hypothetical protein
MKTIKVILTGLITGMVVSCASVKQIGNVNMISTRNVESKTDYVLVKSYAGGSKREIRKSRSKSIDDAINQTVKSTPGGEFLKNVKVYVVKMKYYAVEGDVWGISGQITYRGFKQGDKVTWKKDHEYLKGEITSLKNDKVCLVKADGGEKIIELSYDDISKAN